MKTVAELDICTGCAACAAHCPQGAISMKQAENGYYQPELDATRCNECGACVRLCPQLQSDIPTQLPQDARCFFAYAQDATVRHSASSGGVFPVLAKHVLSAGGTVYGAAFDIDFTVRHVRADNESDASSLVGSKYVQSFIGSDLFDSIETDISEKRPVLFSGTGCQVRALRSFMGADSPLLTCIEVICHGAPSPRLWKSYLDYCQTRATTPLESMSFRDKLNGWENYNLVLNFKDMPSIRHPAGDDWYLRAFIDNLSINEACYACAAKGHSAADLIVGDYWGIGTQHPEVDRYDGVSVVLCLTEAGDRLLAAVEDDLVIGPTTYRQVADGNPALYESMMRPAQRDCFGQDMCSLEIDDLMKRYSFKPSFASRIKGRLRSIANR